MSAAIKAEPLEDMDDNRQSRTTASSSPIPAHSDPELSFLYRDHFEQDIPEADVGDCDNDLDGCDPIIREIDVCISPDLARSMTLVQFPLRPSPSSNIQQQAPKSKHGGRPQQQQNPPRVPHHPLPESARIKPRHGILELTYSLPRSTVEAATTLRSLPDALTFQRRTYKSHSIPMRTHMAAGKLSPDGTRLDLIPLGRVVQMRPDFSHLDEDDDEGGIGGGLGSSSGARAKGGGDEKKKSKPLLFKRPDSDRSIASKRSSFAHKKASEASEDWTELDVCGPRSEEFRELGGSVRCSDPGRELRLLGSAGGGGYTRSLNYLTPGGGDADEQEEPWGEWWGGQGPSEESAEAVMGADGGEGERGAGADTASSKWHRDLTAGVATLLQRGGGVPVPFAVLRSRFPSPDSEKRDGGGVPDDMLATCASACAVLVRGNFVLRSALLGLGDEDAQARDVILLLLDRYGRVRREALVTAFEELSVDYGDMGKDDEIDVDGEDLKGHGPIISADVVNALLDSIAERSQNSVELKVEDDTTFNARFSGLAELHRRYWERREEEDLGCFVKRYEELAELS